ncbi:MAG: preprotein translocase subunit SecE, partial [Actinomycetota bacterium]|nr:preprotein translocase subunit SecE [Actinomycetota bacterium]
AEAAPEEAGERDAARADPPGNGASTGAGSADLAAAPPGPEGGPDPHLAVGAPPEEVGRSDAVLEDEPELDDELEDYDPEDTEQPLDGDDGYAPPGRMGESGDEADRKRPRVIQFLLNSWAELQRVEWPKRQQLITLTWVVIGFVIIAGGFLGLLDAIFSQLVQALL